MEKVEKLKLIEGIFSSQEARDILMNIFNAKIHFNEMKNFGSEERFGKEDENAKRRISELKKEVEKIMKIIPEANLQKRNEL